MDWVMQDEPMRSLFERMPETGICDRVLFDSNWQRIREMDYPGYTKRFRMDVQVAFNVAAEKNLHIAQAYGLMIGVEVSTDEVLPTVPVRTEDLGEFGPPPRCLVISAQSSSNASIDGFAGNKNLPWKAWPQIVELFANAGRIKNHVVLLGQNDPEPEVPMCVLRLSLAQAAAYIAKACAEGGAYCGVDNGITHISAGLGVPTFCVYPAGMAERWVGYPDFPHYRIAKTLAHEGKVQQIWDCWKHRLW
jgi:hypothetical protein